MVADSCVFILITFHSVLFAETIDPLRCSRRTGVEWSAVKRVKYGCLLLNNLPGYFIQIYIVRIPVLIILCDYNFWVMCPRFNFKRPVAHYIGSFCTVCITVLFYNILPLRKHRSCICQRQKVRRRLFQCNLQCLVIYCSYSQLIYGHLSIINSFSILDTGNQIGICCH